MLGRLGGDLACHPAQTFLDQLAERPARAIAREHGQVMQVQGSVPVRVGDFLVINFGQPVVGRDRPAVAQNQAAHGIGHGRIFLHAPVRRLDVAVHQILIVEHGGLDVADVFTLLAVENIRLGHVGIAGLAEHALGAVLNIFNADHVVFDLIGKITGYFQRQQINHGRMVGLLNSVECFRHRRADFGNIKLCDCPVALHNLVHDTSSCFLQS